MSAAVPSNGNAAAALAAYAGRAGMEAYVFVPADCPGMIVWEAKHYGAHTYQINGLIHDAGKIIEDGIFEQRWFNVGTMKEPGRVEGKKTMGYELAEQFGWKLPDVIVYPTGGGSGIIGMWKAFREMRELGWIDCPFPRMISVQEKGCEPLVTALENGQHVKPSAQPVDSAPTGMRVPLPPDGDLVVSILKETGGTAVAVSREEIAHAAKLFGSQGISASPEGAAALAGFIRLSQQGAIEADETVVLFNTAHALKYLPCSRPNIPVVNNYEEWREQAAAKK
jgi:threonine synthase